MQVRGRGSLLMQSVLILLLVLQTCATKKGPPNIVFILTDDQDTVIGGETPITKTKRLIGDEGIIFRNMFATSPLCCPSRSSILTGNYVHNHGAVNNSVDGNCSSPTWQNQSETRAFITYLKKQKYTTFFAGKYLNQYGKPETGGPEHIPPGWDWWNGLVGNSKYYNYHLSVNGTVENHRDNYQNDYFTDIINKRAEEFLQLQSPDSGPFFMMLSTPACHAPFTPAPQYNNSFNDTKAPRNGSFNVYGKDKHWLIRQAKSPLSDDAIATIDNVFRNRWRTLLSVDDMVENVINLLTQRKLLDNTYVFYSSDNGYHLGQFSLPQDKRQLYEFDVRVPLMVRGPGIKAGQLREEIILNIDLAPTFIALSAQTAPSQMDGMSFHNLLAQNATIPASSWRESFVIEHQGEYKQINPGCPQYNNMDLANCDPNCVCEDAKNNTYGCVRTLSADTNYMYCVFEDTENFAEFYDLNKDPDQLSNAIQTVSKSVLMDQGKKLMELSVCQGPSCRKIGPPHVLVN
ncbi:N-acetylglucosamine-6-sulfatase-like [Lingula anatina]|uniref:N-acetylglucosamine-6-sulfatase-like n=1 Tax=Lingula anatina TaxID=7574 RepID=A0A1S3HTU6_LINAN|nr:N-acetylglucosamine-6-sulfatase-like [Lingula anatina]|eukprot:XP_013388966.1 N-acetylglucosamine-6-sulfatase-like [Lingula anatina]